MRDAGTRANRMQHEIANLSLPLGITYPAASHCWPIQTVENLIFIGLAALLVTAANPCRHPTPPHLTAEGTTAKRPHAAYGVRAVGIPSSDLCFVMILVEATRRYSNLDKHLESARTVAAAARRNGRIVERATPPRRHRVADRLDETIINQLVKDYRDGIPTTRLTTRYDLAKGTVLKLLQQHGVTSRSTRRPS